MAFHNLQLNASSQYHEKINDLLLNGIHFVENQMFGQLNQYTSFSFTFSALNYL